MRPIHALPVALVAAALAGCGGGGGSSTTSEASSPPAATTQSTQSTQTQAQTQTTRTAPAKKGPDGAKAFASAGCASCHTLAAANASGQVGPNLDDLQPSADTVRAQVENGGSGMPSFSGDLSPAEIDAVATYVSENAGR